MVVAGDVAGAARAGAHAGRGLDHGADDLGMLAHAEIVVGAPDHDVAWAVRRVPDRVREAARDPLQVGKDPVAPLIPQTGEGVAEKHTVIHGFNASRRPPSSSYDLVLEKFQAACR